MARHYTIKEFFRQMPNALLARLFHGWGLFKNLDFSKMKETKPDELFEAWLVLSEKERKALDSKLQEIFELSCEKGFRAIIDETQWQMQKEADKFSSFIETLSASPNHYHRAMITYLDYPECWKGAARFYHADTLTHWRKRKQMGHNIAAVDEASTKQLADLIRNHFHCTEGRGNHCIVEPLRRGSLDYFFAYPEDYSQQSVEWMEGQLQPKSHNPAFEIVFIYSQKDGTLDLHIHGSYQAVKPLQEMFAIAILKLEKLPPESKDSRVYDLNSLRYRTFGFTYSVSSGIEYVAVKKLRLSSRINPGERLILENDVTQDSMGIYNQLEKIGNAIPLHLYNVTQVELVASVIVDINKPAKRVTIRLTHPNSCSLKYDELGLKLRQMLVSSGIEPKELFDEVEVRELVDA